MKIRKTRFATAGSVAALTLVCTTAWAGELLDAPLLGLEGDGLIFSDPTEGVLPPGVKAVTEVLNGVGEDGWVLNPSNPSSPRGILNCLMANNPGILCDAEPGSGKRVKTQLTGPVPLDMRFGVTPSEGVTSYFTYGKTSNLTGARITSFDFVLGTGSGDSFVPLDITSDVLFDTELIPRFNLPDGLFGNGGQEETGIGFFDENEATMAQTNDEFQITTASLTNDFLAENFGTALLDNSMIPDGMFWDASGIEELPDEEAVLIAWYDSGDSVWRYGNLGVEEWTGSGPEPDGFATLDVRLAALALSLGVDVDDLETTGNDGAEIPANIVAIMTANGLFEEGPVEDIRNTNLNFMLEIGDIDGGEFTLRIAPVFEPIVEFAAESQSEYQFRLAGYLDAAANVPYWEVDPLNTAAYLAAIGEIVALAETDPEAAAAALTSTGFTIAPAYSAMSFESARGHVAAISGLAPIDGGDTAVVSQSGGARNWLMGGNLYGLASLGGSTATYDPTSGSIGYDVDATSFTVGVESRVNANASVGIAVGGTSATAEAADGLGDLETTGLSFIGFARSNMDNGASFKALFGYQDASYDSTRNVLDQTATGSTEGSQTFGAVEASYLRDFGGFSVGPMASVSFYNVTVDGFTETGAGAFNLTVEEQTGSTFMGSIGLKGEYLLPSATGKSRLTGSIAYSTLSSDDLTIETGFSGLPTVAFPIEGRDDDLVDVKLGFESLISSNTARDIRIEAGYGGSFGDTYERHGFQVGMNVQF
jgi:uncharacterized protein YhjY with autotransporter beta-barrel domain